MQNKTNQSITPHFILDVFRRWWKLAVPAGIVLGASAVAVIVIFFTKEIYQAQAWLSIEDSSPYVVFRDNEASRQFVETQVQLIRSPLVLSSVVSNPEIAQISEISEAEDPIAVIAGAVTAKPVGRSELFQISYESDNPQNAAAIVNAIVDSYFRLHKTTEANQVQEVVDLLEGEQQRRKKGLNIVRDYVRELTIEATGKDPYVAAEAEAPTRRPLADWENRLVDTEVNCEILQAQLKAFENSLEAGKEIPIPETAIEQILLRDPEVAKLEADLLDKQARLRELETLTRDGKTDKRYIVLDKEIEQDQDSLDKLKGDLRKQTTTSLQETTRRQRDDQLTEMKQQLEEFRLVEAFLKKRCKTGIQERQAGSGVMIDLEFKRAEFQRAEEVYELIGDRILKLRTEQRAPSRITLLQSATTPLAPQTMSYKKAGMAGLAMFFLPFGLVLLWERMVGRVSDGSQFEEATSISVIGEIARLPSRAVGVNVSSSGRLSREIAIFEESIDSLRTHLVLSQSLGNIKTLAVTSAVNNEGKTSVAVQLAVSIARASGQPTLLVDADMRSPDIHNKFDISLEPGLAEVLSRECSLEDAVVSDWSKNLNLLPAGKLRSSPHTLLGNGSVQPLFEKFRENYHYVVIDTPPVLAAAEALVLARSADASIICAMRDVSRVSQIRKTQQRLAAAGTAPVGVVLNAIPTRKYASRYGSYTYSLD